MFLRKNFNFLKTLFNQNLNENEQNQEKRKNDGSSSKSPEKEIQKSKLVENDIILFQQKENNF